jgi:hypothetical protein
VALLWLELWSKAKERSAGSALLVKEETITCAALRAERVRGVQLGPDAEPGLREAPGPCALPELDAPQVRGGFPEPAAGLVWPRVPVSELASAPLRGQVPGE